MVPSTVGSSVPPSSLPSLDPEQMLPMQLARPGIADVIPDHSPHGTVEVTNDPPPSRTREAGCPSCGNLSHQGAPCSSSDQGAVLELGG